MRVRVNSGRTVAYNGKAHTAGDVLDVADEQAERWIAAGDAKATLGAKPVAAPRPLSPNPTSRARAK